MKRTPHEEDAKARMRAALDPVLVTEVHANTPDIARFLAWFAGPLPSRGWICGDVSKTTTGHTEGAAEYGTLGANLATDYGHTLPEKIARFNEYRRRNGLTEEGTK